eukprot:CAMPEP_0113709524 /NCGR_PEP_ID=MMETSP0038_2-20120614/29620_1 /TAXON_ID=2898 /ORGANISM="Cryptomonas paramecium" /LENGTH=72 /DNA_ID=CAMNT_0000635421 /DNA_START=557 /DNA_END=772 /DNA_ORIENTATION=+ /assembly_acc=CAM_ASM_000170
MPQEEKVPDAAVARTLVSRSSFVFIAYKTFNGDPSNWREWSPDHAENWSFPMTMGTECEGDSTKRTPGPWTH